MTMNKANDFRFVIIGAGMAGILSAIRLQQAGFTNVTVYEKASNIGGTWRENTYPGLTCDVASHAYTYSFEPNPEWSHYLSSGAEIQDYFERTVKKYGVDKLIQFNQPISTCDFVDGRWHIETENGIKDSADFVIAATGVLHAPNYPKLAGMENFKGDMFHSARWDHSVALDGKRIGLIGNGSTGVQIVSALADRVEQLTHFQRTPQWIMPIENPAFTEEQKQSFRDDPALLKHMQNEPEYLATVANFNEAIVAPDSDAMHQIEDFVKQNLEQSVSDPVLREKLRPDYRAACKRLVFSPDYYNAVQQPSVSVITDGIEQIEANGVRTQDGVLHEVDVLVLATGFKADQFMRPMKVTGRNGIDLEQAWADRPKAYLSISIPDFPNLFMLNGPSGPVGNFSLIDIAEHQWNYITQLVDWVIKGECKEVSVTHEALAQFDKDRVAAAKKTIFGSGCRSWYLDAQGVPATWPWSQARFYEAMEKPDREAYELVH